MRVIVTAPARVDTSPVLHVLRDLNAEAASLRDLAVGAQFAAVEPPYALIAVLTDEESRSSAVATYVEVGIALGKGMPVFLIVEPPAIAPAALQSLPQVATRWDDEANLRLHIGSFWQ
jgi:hypothetical protein